MGYIRHKCSKIFSVKHLNGTNTDGLKLKFNRTSEEKIFCRFEASNPRPFGSRGSLIPMCRRLHCILWLALDWQPLHRQSVCRSAFEVSAGLETIIPRTFQVQGQMLALIFWNTCSPKGATHITKIIRIFIAIILHKDDKSHDLTYANLKWRSCLLLRRSEFESRWLLKFSAQKDQNKLKRGRGWPIF